jgi:hypothetical protein
MQPIARLRVPSTPRRRTLAALIPAAALLLAGTAVASLATAGSAAATGSADVAVSQLMTGGSSDGHTTDTITLRNIGSATASAVNANIFFNSNSGVYTEGLASSGYTCEIMPPPPGYQHSLSCQLGAPLAAASTKTLVLDLGGDIGAQFTSTVSVGILNQTDASYANNLSTVTSYYGPRADLGVTGTATTGTTAGTAKAVTTVGNHGPNDAKALQLIVEIKATNFQGVSVSATPLSSCQIIPPATGYQAAVSCVTDTLTAHHNWVLTFSYQGGAGTSLTMKSTVSANTPIDPVTTNNTMTKTTTFHA